MTVSTPEPPTSAELLASTTVPRMSAAAAGFVTEPVGFVLSTRTVIVAEVKELPALSVVTTRRSYWPSACRVVFQLGGLVRPGAGAGGGALEGDGVDAGAAVGGVARQRDRVADAGRVGGRRDRPGRVRVVDAHRDRRRGEGVAGVVGGDDAEVVLAVGLQGGVPARGLVRPGARADRRALELDGRDARATGIGRVARQADRAADVGCSRPEQ